MRYPRRRTALHHCLEAVHDDEGRGCDRHTGAGAHGIRTPERSGSPRRQRQHARRHQGRELHLHVVVGTRHAAEGVPRGWWQVVDLRDLGQEHLYARPCRLPAAIRADPVRLERRRRPLLVRCARSGRRVAVRQAAQERPAPDDEAGRSRRASHQELVKEPGYRARSVWRFWHHDDRGGADGPAGAAAGTGSAVLRCGRPEVAGDDWR